MTLCNIYGSAYRSSRISPGKNTEAAMSSLQGSFWLQRSNLHLHRSGGFLPWTAIPCFLCVLSSSASFDPYSKVLGVCLSYWFLGHTLYLLIASYKVGGWNAPQPLRSSPETVFSISYILYCNAPPTLTFGCCWDSIKVLLNTYIH